LLFRRHNVFGQIDSVGGAALQKKSRHLLFSSIGRFPSVLELAGSSWFSSSSCLETEPLMINGSGFLQARHPVSRTKALKGLESLTQSREKCQPISIISR